MKPRKLKTGTFVFFDWLDSHAFAGWKACGPGVSQIESLGIVVSTTETTLTVTTSVADNEQYIDALSVPWAAIQSLTLVGFEPPPRKAPSEKPL